MLFCDILLKAGSVIKSTAAGEDGSRTLPVEGDQLPVYAALLVQVSMPDTADYFFRLGPDPLSINTYRARVFVQFGVGGSVAGPGPVLALTEYATGTPAPLVVHYAFGASGAETRLFINPGAAEPATADATITEPASAAPLNLGTVALRQGNNTSALVLNGLNYSKTLVVTMQ